MSTTTLSNFYRRTKESIISVLQANRLEEVDVRREDVLAVLNELKVDNPLGLMIYILGFFGRQGMRLQSLWL